MTRKGYGVYARLSAQGDNFSPRSAEKATGTRFSEKNEPGDLGTSGRYKDMPLPYGSAQLELPSSSTEELLNADAPPFKDPAFVGKLRSSGASEITLYIDVAYQSQCNFELSPKLLRALSDLGVAVGFSCFQEDKAS